MTHRLLIALIPILAGCTSGPPIDAPDHDGVYTVQIRAQTPRDLTIDWCHTAQPHLVADECRDVAGWSRHNVNGRSCAIHVPIPANYHRPSDAELKAWGEEVMHCYYGAFHE